MAWSSAHASKAARASAAREPASPAAPASPPSSAAPASPPASAASRTAPLLVVLDLNGTLVYRRKNSSGRAIQGAKITPRPYLGNFLRYCLGPLYDLNERQLRDAWPESERVLVSRNVAPHGTQFWLRNDANTGVYEPPRTPVALMVWSSATEANVDRMLEQFTETRVQRALFQRVWSRATLVRAQDMERKVSTVKDLSIVWDDLNHWRAHVGEQTHVQRHMRFPGRVLATNRLAEYHRAARAAHRAAHDEWVTVQAKRSPPAQSRPPRRIVPYADELYDESVQRTAHGGRDSVYGPLVHTPWGPHNTLLLDDSGDKARCQPENHVQIHEYERASANAFRDAQSASAHADDADGADDDYLLRCIGMLDAMRDVPDVTAWLGTDDHRRLLLSDQPDTVRAHWCERGRAALARLAIPIEP